MKELCYGSVCSGIEAASIAWEPLGMRPVWFAEIESFPSAVLAHRWPHVANLGDMTKLAKKVLAGEIESPDVLVGGTPCQAFSIAGLRGGLDDERGALTLKYVELANAIDDKRAESFLKPAVIVWENVPGVLSSADNAFGCFLAGLAGEDVPFEPGDRPESGKSNAFWRWDGKTGCHVPKWPQCGCIYGPQRKVAWRILDAQYFGVAQRRRRVFVVASARTDLDPATVLFEFEGVRRNIAPSR
ncbi:DNA cytosine methyltransferase, partial [Escherichia coli]|nr:DNA cytosine methyltransferase [Escherichia coli]